MMHKVGLSLSLCTSTSFPRSMLYRSLTPGSTFNPQVFLQVQTTLIWGWENNGVLYDKWMKLSKKVCFSDENVKYCVKDCSMLVEQWIDSVIEYNKEITDILFLYNKLLLGYQMNFNPV